MNFVYFGQDLNRRAPDLFGHICNDPMTQWVGLLDISAALQSGHSVSIRHATESELKRAEALIALRNVGEEMARSIHQLLDEHPAAVATAAMTRIRDAIESVEDTVPYQLLDQ